MGKSQAKLHCGDRKKQALFDADRCKIHHGDRTVKIHRYLESSEHQEHFFSIMLARLMRSLEVRWRKKMRCHTFLAPSVSEMTSALRACSTKISIDIAVSAWWLCCLVPRALGREEQ